MRPITAFAGMVEKEKFSFFIDGDRNYEQHPRCSGVEHAKNASSLGKREETRWVKID